MAKVKKAEKSAGRSAIRIVDETHCNTTREHDPNDKWDQDDTSTSHNIKGIEIADKKKSFVFHDMEVPFKVRKHVTYFLLYVIYSTGDSFHHSEGEINFVDLYESRDFAEANKILIEEHYKAVKGDGDDMEEFRDGGTTRKAFEKFTIALQRSNGNVMNTHVPWTGYFERMTSVSIKEVRVIE